VRAQGNCVCSPGPAFEAFRSSKTIGDSTIPAKGSSLLVSVFLRILSGTSSSDTPSANDVVARQVEMPLSDVSHSSQCPPGTVESLLKPENRDQLRKVLTYHVVPGWVRASDLSGKRLAAGSVEGSKLRIDARRGKVKVEGATVTKADIAASNGVIHVINAVMIPNS
jgi:hypothetical protein